LKEKLSDQTKHVSNTFWDEQIKIAINREQHCYCAKNTVEKKSYLITALFPVKPSECKVALCNELSPLI